MIERAISMLEEQQSKVQARSPQWIVGEQLKDICRQEPHCAELIAQDLENPAMSITEAEKAAAVNQNGDMALFNVIFNQTQEGVNKMHGLRLKLGKADEALDEKLKTAINALADAVRRCAE